MIIYKTKGLKKMLIGMTEFHKGLSQQQQQQNLGLAEVVLDTIFLSQTLML